MNTMDNFDIYAMKVNERLMQTLGLTDVMVTESSEDEVIKQCYIKRVSIDDCAIKLLGDI